MPQIQVLPEKYNTGGLIGQGIGQGFAGGLNAGLAEYQQQKGQERELSLAKQLQEAKLKQHYAEEERQEKKEQQKQQQNSKLLGALYEQSGGDLNKMLQGIQSAPIDLQQKQILGNQVVAQMKQQQKSATGPKIPAAEQALTPDMVIARDKVKSHPDYKNMTPEQVFESVLDNKGSRTLATQMAETRATELENKREDDKILRSNFESERDYSTKVSDKILEQMRDFDASYDEKVNNLDQMESTAKDLSFTGWLSAKTGLPLGTSPADAQFQSAVKNFTVEDIKSLGSRPNVWIDKQIFNSLPSIDKREWANKVVIEAKRYGVDVAKNYWDNVRNLSAQDIKETSMPGKSGYVKRDVAERARALNDIYQKGRLKESKLKIQTYMENDDPSKIQSLDKAEPGTPLTPARLAYLESITKDPEVARQMAKNLGYEVPEGEEAAMPQAQVEAQPAQQASPMGQVPQEPQSQMQQPAQTQPIGMPQETALEAQGQDIASDTTEPLTEEGKSLPAPLLDFINKKAKEVGETKGFGSPWEDVKRVIKEKYPNVANALSATKKEFNARKEQFVSEINEAPQRRLAKEAEQAKETNTEKPLAKEEKSKGTPKPDIWDSSQKRVQVRALESLIGLPGNAEAVGKWMIGFIPGLKDHTTQHLPTSTDVRNTIKDLTAGAFEPKTEMDEKIDALGSNIVANAMSGGLGFFRTLAIPVIGASTKEGLTYTGFSKNVSDLAASGTMLFFDVMAGRIQNGGARQYATGMLNDADKRLTPGSYVHSRDFNKEARKLEKEMTKGGKSDSHGPALTKIEESLKFSTGGKLPMENAVGMRKTVNEIIEAKGGFDLTKDKSIGKKAVYWLNRFKSLLLKATDQYAKVDPEWGKLNRAGNEAYATWATSNSLGNILQKNFGDKVSDPLTRKLFGFVGVGAKAAATVGAVGLWPIYHTQKIVHRMVASPALRNHYSQVMKNAVEGNILQAGVNMNAIERTMQQMDIKEKKQQFTLVEQARKDVAKKKKR